MIITAIKAENDGFYILHEGLHLEILKFNFEGQITEAYFNTEARKFSFRDFIVFRHNTEDLFYLLQTSPNNEITVFGQNQIN